MSSSNEHTRFGATNGSTDEATRNSSPETNGGDKPRTKLPFYSRAWTWWVAKTGIDLRTYMSMFKGAAAPAVAIGFYQANAVADQYTTIGYLVGIMTVLSVVIAPRSKFIQTMVINVFSVCFACAVCLLAMYSAVQARINSEGGAQAPGTGGSGTSGLAAGGAQTAQYSSSGSAVAAVWLFAEIYTISVIRALRPQFTVPCICAAIFANVSSVYVPQFSTMAQAEAFAKQLLKAMLTGFAIATAVSLLVFPLTSRQIVFTEVDGYLTSLRAAVKANLDYIHSLEDTDIFAPHRVNTAGVEVPGSQEAKVLKDKATALATLHAKFSTDLPFAKREVSMGKLGPDDLQSLFKMLRLTMIPTVALASLSDIFQRIAEVGNWDVSQTPTIKTPDDSDSYSDKTRIESLEEWHALIKSLREPFGDITAAIDQGLEHVAIRLQLGGNRIQRDTDIEADAAGQQPGPGEKGFAASYNQRSLAFLLSKQKMLRDWCSLHDIVLSDDFFDDPTSKNFDAPQWMREGHVDGSHVRLRRQLFIGLYVEFLLFNISRRVYEMILFVEGLQASGKLSRTRLVVPGLKRLRKWAIEIFAHEVEGHDAEQIDTGGKGATVYLGAAYGLKKDPEHLPPSTAWQRSSNSLRSISHFFASPASAFGFRVAVATMSIAIVCFLKDTQTLFTEQRLFWSQIMISISMSPSAGQSLRNFGLRIFGTMIAMLLAWVAYYIVDGHVPGVLIFMFLVLHFGVWILLKHPSLTPVGMISQVTVCLIIGYELQVRKIGVARATSNGQAYWPAYILGPIRLATVCGGLALAWFWTVFPYPMTESSVLRKNVGRSMYLMANYYSVLHETFKVRTRGGEGDVTSKDSPGYKLDKARHKIYAKTNVLLASTRAQAGFVRFDIPVGGPFPREEYSKIINLLQDSLNFMALISLATASFTELEALHEQYNSSEWLKNFRKLIGEANVTSQAITTLLSLMSAALEHGHPLPPYLQGAEAWSLTARLEELDTDLLSVRHIAEPGYASLAVVQVAQKCLVDDLNRVLVSVKALVGELDFSYHIVSTGDTPESKLEQVGSHPRDQMQDEGRGKRD